MTEKQAQRLIELLESINTGMFVIAGILGILLFAVLLNAI